MRWKPFVAGVLAAALMLVLGVLVAGVFTTPAHDPEPAVVVTQAPEYPGGHPIDASQISSGRLSMERLPSEVTAVLDYHTEEIVKTADLVSKKQARIRGTCPPGSAIRAVQENGTVVCERIPRGVISVSALTGVARESSSKTGQGAVNGAVGRYQLEGADDFLVVPLQLPDGAVVTSFSYTFYDDSAKWDTSAYLYRSDDVPLAIIQTEGANKSVRTVSTDNIQNPRIDNRDNSYFVYMRISTMASSDLMPIAASVSYKLP